MLLCSPMLHLFDYSKIVKYHYNKKSNLFLWWQSLIFSFITPVSSVSDPSKSILI